MALTGEAVLIANSNKYGQNEGAPRGCAGDGTHLYVIGNNRKRLIRVTNLETFASEYASAAITATIQSLAFLDGDAYFSAGTALHRIDAPLTDLSTPTALTGTLPSNIFSLASDGTYLYGYRQSDNTIHRITITSAQPTDTFTAASFATVTFPTGVSTNIRSFFYLDGAFYFVNLSDNRLYKSPENITAGSTVAATRVGNFTNFGVGASGVHGAGVLNENAYFASGASDNLYRFYNVRWDKEIDAVEVDEGANASLDLSTVSQDATSFAFAPSHTARSWLTLSGTTLTITNAPAVTADTNFDVVVRAVRGSVNVDKTLTIAVRDTTPRVSSAPRNVRETDTGPDFIDVEWDVPADKGLPEIDDYEIRIKEGQTAGGTWTSTGSTATSAKIVNLKKATQYTLQVRAVNSVGAGPASAAITVSTDVPTPPVWQTGNALRQTINAGESVTVDIGALVPNADAVDEIFGLQFQWMEYNEATGILKLEDAPIVREDTYIKIRFLAKNDVGEVPTDYIITLKGSVLASLHNMLFFEEPLSFETGRITRHGTSTIVLELTDNKKETFTTHTDFDINIADANGDPTAFDYILLILKGSNLRVSITPTGGVGRGFANRVVSQTIKNIGGGEVSKVVDGLLYDLYPLPQRITATNVRLRVNGTNPQIHAVMLLKLGWELDANSEFIEMEFDRVDRAGILSETPDGYIKRSQVLGAEGFKWEGQFTVIVKGSDVDEWMDWTEANMNCAFAREPSRHPEDIFLAFFPTLEMPNGYLGLVKSVGETIEFGVAEQ